MQLRKLFQQFAVGRVVCLDAAFHSGHFAFAKLHRALGLVALLKERLFFQLQFCNCFVLLAGIFLPLRLDLFDSFLDLRNPKRDFLLFLLQLLQRDDLIAQLGKIRRLRSAFAPEVDFTLLQQPFLVTERHASSLTLYL